MNAPQPMTALQLQQLFINIGVPASAATLIWSNFVREMQQGDCNIPVLLMDFARQIGAEEIQKIVVNYRSVRHSTHADTLVDRTNSAMIEMRGQVVLDASGSHMTIEATRCPELTVTPWPQTKALNGALLQTKSLGETSKDSHVKRPANHFLLFRQFQQSKEPYRGMPFTQQCKSRLSQVTNQSNYILAGEIAAVWRALGEEKKDYWKRLAKEESRRHKLAHPDYKFSPRKPGQIKKRISSKQRQNLAAAAARDDQPAEGSSDANNLPTSEPGPTQLVPHSEIPMTSLGNAVIDLGDPDLDDEDLRRYLTSYNNFISNRPNYPINPDAINFTCLHSEPTEASLSQKIFYESCADFNVGDSTWEEFMEEGAFA